MKKHREPGPARDATAADLEFHAESI